MLCWGAIRSGSYGEVNYVILCIGKLGCVELWQLRCCMLRCAWLGFGS